MKEELREMKLKTVLIYLAVLCGIFFTILFYSKRLVLLLFSKLVLLMVDARRKIENRTSLNSVHLKMTALPTRKSMHYNKQLFLAYEQHENGHEDESKERQERV